MGLYSVSHSGPWASSHAVSPADLGAEVMGGLNTCLQRFYHGNSQNQQAAFTEFMTWENAMSAPRKFTSNLPLLIFMGIF